MSPTPDMTTHIGKLVLDNPVMVASGTFGFGEEYDGLMDVRALGAIVTKGISLEPRVGNPAPRTAETPCGMINSVGLQNPGLRGFVEHKLPWLKEVPCKVVVNILGDTVEEYATLARELDGVPGVDAMEVNISCPNVEHGGMTFGSDPQTARRVAEAVRAETDKPVLVKLSPNVTSIVQVAEAVITAEIDGLTLINTISAMAIDYATGKPLLGAITGGLSGPAIKPVAVRAVFEVARACETSIVGCGGIASWQDAVEFIRAGASAVQVGSATFRSPSSAVRVIDGLRGFLSHIDCSSCRELVGKVNI